MESKYIVPFTNKSFILKDVSMYTEADLFRSLGGRWFKKPRKYPTSAWVFPIESKDKVLSVVSSRIISSAKEKEIEDIISHSQDHATQKRYHRAISAGSDSDEEEEVKLKPTTYTKKSSNEPILGYIQSLDDIKRKEKIKQFEQEKEQFDKAHNLSSTRAQKKSSVEKVRPKIETNTKKSQHKKEEKSSSNELRAFYKAFSKNPKAFQKLYGKRRSPSVSASSSSSESESEQSNFESEESENSSSSDDYPIPESPYKKKLTRLSKNEPVFAKLKEIEKKLYKMESEKARRRK